MLKLKQIHRDKRGKIHVLLDDEGNEIASLLSTKQHFARGGCIHKKNNEHCVVLKGRILYSRSHFPTETGSKGTVFFIKKNTPHYFVSLTDSLVMEFGATPEEQVKHKATRKIVDRINAEAII
jgi:quercetin dioxygenase-like cupin family protein